MALMIWKGIDMETRGHDSGIQAVTCENTQDRLKIASEVKRSFSSFLESVDRPGILKRSKISLPHENALTN
jgi:hypothetical protein